MPEETQEKPKPKIYPIPNGPLGYMTDFAAIPVDGLVDEEGKTCANQSGTSLCRCGASTNKPFCVGLHSTIGFSDRAETDGHLDRRVDYEGQEITIHDNRGICAHTGFCTRGLPDVFRLGVEPWIDPDGAPAARIIETIRKCPSGALGYSVDGVEHRDQERDPLVTVSKDGPYYVTGGIEVVGHANRAEGVSEEHATLCRCGSSKNKPFCDGTHWQIGFKGTLGSQ